MDIATLLESHRRYMLEVVAGKDYDSDAESKLSAAIAHDRATTKTLLDLYRQGNSQPTNNTATSANNTVTITTRRVKAGSKKARDRAIKAGETRRRNLAAKAGQQQSQSQAQATDASPAGEQVQP